MFLLFAANVRLARPVFTIACSNPVTRSFITSSRVADAKPKTAGLEQEITTEKKPKRGRPEKVDKPKKSKDKPKKIVITEDMKPPQKPHHAYVRFVKEYVGKHPKASSGAETVALIKACAAEWKTLSDAARATYAEGYSQELEEYRKKRAAWVESISPEMAKTINGARKAAGKPSISFKMSGKPKTPYIRFYVQLQQNDDMKSIATPERARRAGEIWRSMPQDEKQKYIDSYTRDRVEWLARKASVKA